MTFPSTVFVPGTTITHEWLNAVNDACSNTPETVNVTAFGAKCDCVITGYTGDTRTYTGTPDDEAIEAAIAYLRSKNGGTLIFPGLSLCTRSVVISSNITLLGLDPHDCGVFFGQGPSSGPYWIGTPYSPSDPYYGVITKVENVRISNMRISSYRKDPGESQVYPNIYKSWGIGGQFKNSIIENCYSDWMTYDFVDITDNYDDGATYIGDNTIRNNLVENMGRHGITCRGTRNWIVQNNHIQDCALRGITAELDSIHQYANSYVVENNTISNTETGITLDSYPSSTNNISVFVKSNIITGTTGTRSAIFDMSVSTPSQGNVIFVATNQFDKTVGFKSSQFTTATNNIFNGSIICETANDMVFSNNVIYGPISFNYSDKIALYDNTFNLKTAGSFNYAVQCANTNTKLLCENNVFNVSNGTFANLIDAYLISDKAVLRQNTLNVSGSGAVTQNVQGTALMYYNTFGTADPSVYVEMTPKKVTSYSVLNAGTQTVNVLTNEASGLFMVYSAMSVNSSNNSWAKWVVQKYGNSFYSITADGHSGGSASATATINATTGEITITNATGYTSHIFTTVKSL